MEELVRASLVEKYVHPLLRDAYVYATYPFITAHAEQQLRTEDRRDFSLKVAEWCSAVASEIYGRSSSPDARAVQSLLVIEESNIWACLDPKRPFRPQQGDEPVSPVAAIAGMLPQALLSVHRPRDAARAAELGRDVCIAIGDVHGEADALLALGDARARLSEWEPADEAYKAAEAAYERVGFSLGVANARKQRGDNQMRIDDRAGARELYEQALPVFKRGRHRSNYANTVLALGRIHLAEGDLKRARKLFRNALSRYRAIEHLLGTANALSAIGDLEHRQGRLATSLRNYEEALLLYGRLQNGRGIANTLIAIGNIKRLQGKLAEAERYYPQAMMIANVLRDGPLTAAIRQSLGLVRLDQARLDDAIAEFDAAFDLHEGLVDLLAMAADLRLLALAYFRNGQYHRSYTLAYGARAVYGTTGSAIDEANALLVMGDALQILGQYGAAWVTLVRAQELAAGRVPMIEEIVRRAFAQFREDAGSDEEYERRLAVVLEHGEELLRQASQRVFSESTDDTYTRQLMDRLRGPYGTSENDAPPAGQAVHV
jgi:tetratricopeptide (TPR) repeat protein